MEMPGRDFSVICLKASQWTVQNSTQNEPQTRDSNFIHVKLRQTATLFPIKLSKYKHIHYSHSIFLLARAKKIIN